LWSSAISSGIMTFILFTFLDPLDLVETFHLDVDPLIFRLKAYAGAFAFFWLTFITSTYLCLFYNQLAQQARCKTEN
jgi:hypothetical protein